MKFMILVLLALLVAPALGMTDKEAGYIAGIENGYELGYLAHSGLGNATAAQMFNDLATKYNAYLDGIGGQKYKIEPLQIPDHSYVLPAFLQNIQGTDPWAGVPGPSKHTIDGGIGTTEHYATDDANGLPDSARYNSTTKSYSDLGGNYLPGV